VSGDWTEAATSPVGPSDAQSGSHPDGDGNTAPSAHHVITSSPHHPRPRIGRAIGRGLAGAYEYLGTVLVASMLWIGLAAILGTGGAGLVSLALEGRGVLLLSLLGGIAAAGIGTGPLTLALFDHVRRLLIHEDPRWWELLAALPSLWRRGLALSGLQVAVTLVLAVDTLFFMSQSSTLLRLVGIGCLYPLLFWCGAALLQWPLAADRTGDSVRVIVKKSLLLFLDNLGFMMVMAVMVIVLTVICLITRFGLVLAWAGTLAFILTAGLRELLPKYDLLPPERGTVGDGISE
jgi:hypothetical protein